jgi:hypothetical protein
MHAQAARIDKTGYARSGVRARVAMLALHAVQEYWMNGDSFF